MHLYYVIVAYLNSKLGDEYYTLTLVGYSSLSPHFLNMPSPSLRYKLRILCHLHNNFFIPPKQRNTHHLKLLSHFKQEPRDLLHYLSFRRSLIEESLPDLENLRT
jgi:hypothetical protein